MSIVAPSLPGSAKVIEPPVIEPLRGRMPMTAWEMTDLPEPDSPTRATTEPGLMRKSTPLTTSIGSPCRSKAMRRSLIVSRLPSVFAGERAGAVPEDWIGRALSFSWVCKAGIPVRFVVVSSGALPLPSRS